MWTQPELFDWNDPECFLPKVTVKVKRTRKNIDYDSLYNLFLAGPVRFKDIEQATGVSHNAVALVITTLSLRYPIYELKRGVYKLATDEDYGNGIKRSLVQNEES